ncbi:MAG: hypothetical protein AAGB93_10860 [Planctomycetota bacterium]
MHPDFPIVHGVYRLSPAWILDLPVELNRRLDGEELVLWRAGLSLRFVAHADDDDLTPIERVARERLVLGDGARDVEEEQVGDVARMTFFDDLDGREVLRSIAFHDAGRVEALAHIDEDVHLPIAYAILASVRYSAVGRPSNVA